MPRTAKQSKADLTGQLSAVFERYGYEGASLAMLAQAAGLSKASLYHHFPNGKEDMAANVLASAGQRLQKLILSPLAQSRDGAERLLNALEGTAIYYSGDIPVCLMNSLLLGGGTGLFGSQIAAAVGVWQQGLTAGYKDAGATSEEAEAWASYAIERIQGALVLCRVRSSRTPLEDCLSNLRADVDALNG